MINITTTTHPTSNIQSITKSLLINIIPLTLPSYISTYYLSYSSIYYSSLLLSPYSLLGRVDTVVNTSTTLPINSTDNNLNKELEEYHLLDEELKTSQIPTFIINSSTLHIPNKVESVLRGERYIKKELKKINEDEDVAIELCLIFISNLSNAYFTTDDGWKRLWSQNLKKQLGTNKDKKFLYKIIIDFLSNKKNFKSGAIIQVDGYHNTGVSRRYKMHDRFYKKGITTYELKNEKNKAKQRTCYYESLSKAQDNVIGSYMLKLYAHVQVPTVNQIKKEARRIIKAKEKVGKGKLLKFQHRNGRNTIDTKTYSIVEESIDLFIHLTDKGYMVPTSSEAAGNRVVDSFTLMPTWIRNLCKIDGEQIEDCDYTCLHPNIAMKIYGGPLKFITHQMVADELEEEKNEVKVEHLSFFNKTWKQMKKSMLFDFYEKHCPHMLNNIFNRKEEKYDLKNNDEGHKNACLDLFGMEVDILTKVIEKLSSEDIYGFYVYDAIKPSASNKDRVAKIMNEVSWEFGVMTSVDGGRPKEKQVEVKPLPEPVVIKPMVKIEKKFDSDLCFSGESTADESERSAIVARMRRVSTQPNWKHTLQDVDVYMYNESIDEKNRGIVEEEIIKFK